MVLELGYQDGPGHQTRSRARTSSAIGSVRALPARVKPPAAVRRRAPAGLLAALSLLAGCAAPRQRVRVALAGAQIPLELVESWLSAAEDCAFHVERVAPVYLSRHGFAALARAACDLACTDRRISERERAALGRRPVAGCRVGFYGYALYVHPDNPLDSIFAGHIKLVFRRRVTDWAALGGRAGPIRLYGPPKATRGGMILMRQAGIWFAEPTWTPLESDLQVVARVAADPGGLGFASIGFDRGVRYLGLRMRRGDPPAFPSREEIESERYGLAKLVYLYFESPARPPVRAVLDYIFSPPGRAAIEATRVWPIPRQRALLKEQSGQTPSVGP